MSVSVTNLMQAIWFAANFLLYCGCAVRRRSNASTSANSGSAVGARLLQERHCMKTSGVSYQLRGHRAMTSSPLTTAL